MPAVPGADSRSSVLREETDSVCTLYISHVHPWAPGRAPFCPVGLLIARFLGGTPLLLWEAASQVPAAALKQPRAHHHLSFMTPERQCRQGKSPAGGRGRTSQTEPREQYALQQWLFQWEGKEALSDELPTGLTYPYWPRETTRRLTGLNQITWDTQ